MIKTKEIKQTITIRASSHDVYEALMDSKKHTEFTGELAKISRKVGGTFSIYDGYGTGKNIELVADSKIVQTWRTSDWPAGHYSTVTFLFKNVPGGTKLTFNQANIPREDAKSISDGWKTYYWKPLKEMLEL